MPYIITTKGPEYTVRSGDITERFVSRRAVAALEKARAVVDAYFDPDHPVSTLLWTGEKLPATWTLPDGTVIEVERVEWDALVRATGLGHAVTGDAEIIAAYNESQA